MKIFNYSKWKPVTSFEYCGNSYIIFARINKRTGMMYFRQKRLNSFGTLSYRYPSIDVNKEFEKLLKEIEHYEEAPQNLPKADAYSLLAEVRADIQELLKSIDEYHETFSTAELESFSRQKLDAGIKMMRLKNKISEHFS